MAGEAVLASLSYDLDNINVQNAKPGLAGKLYWPMYVQTILALYYIITWPLQVKHYCNYYYEYEEENNARLLHGRNEVSAADGGNGALFLGEVSQDVLDPERGLRERLHLEQTHATKRLHLEQTHATVYDYGPALGENETRHIFNNEHSTYDDSPDFSSDANTTRVPFEKFEFIRSNVPSFRCENKTFYLEGNGPRSDYDSSLSTSSTTTDTLLFDPGKDSYASFVSFKVVMLFAFLVFIVWHLYKGQYNMVRHLVKFTSEKSNNKPLKFGVGFTLMCNLASGYGNLMTHDACGIMVMGPSETFENKLQYPFMLFYGIAYFGLILWMFLWLFSCGSIVTRWEKSILWFRRLLNMGIVVSYILRLVNLQYFHLQFDFSFPFWSLFSCISGVDLILSTAADIYLSIPPKGIAFIHSYFGSCGYSYNQEQSQVRSRDNMAEDTSVVEVDSFETEPSTVEQALNVANRLANEVEERTEEVDRRGENKASVSPHDTGHSVDDDNVPMLSGASGTAPLPLYSPIVRKEGYIDSDRKLAVNTKTTAKEYDRPRGTLRIGLGSSPPEGRFADVDKRKEKGQNLGPCDEEHFVHNISTLTAESRTANVPQHQPSVAGKESNQNPDSGLDKITKLHGRCGDKIIVSKTTVSNNATVNTMSTVSKCEACPRRNLQGGPRRSSSSAQFSAQRRIMKQQRRQQQQSKKERSTELYATQLPDDSVKKTGLIMQPSLRERNYVPPGPHQGRAACLIIAEDIFCAKAEHSGKVTITEMGMPDGSRVIKRVTSNPDGSKTIQKTTTVPTPIDCVEL